MELVDAIVGNWEEERGLGVSVSVNRKSVWWNGILLLLCWWC
jgi:hypothetical protein